MVRTFTAAVHQEDEWYVARCLELDVASQGESVGEALANLREAVELYLDKVSSPVIELAEERSLLSLVGIVAMAGRDFEVGASDAVDEPVLVVDAARRPSGQRTLQHFRLAESGALGIPLNIDDQLADAARHLRVST